MYSNIFFFDIKENSKNLQLEEKEIRYLKIIQFIHK